MSLSVLSPEWPAPDAVKALVSTRQGGFSQGPWRSLNLGANCGDEGEHVDANRRRLTRLLPGAPRWLKQVHGTAVASFTSDTGSPGERLPGADASVTSLRHVVLAVLTADCLPVLLCDTSGTRVGIAHAGWRGLAAGVIENAVREMCVPPADLLAWLGPAIGGDVYEVGDEVRSAFLKHGSGFVTEAFQAHGDRWKLHLVAAARGILQGVGLRQVFGGSWCTFSDPDRFYSHRRDGVTGRMASCIWID